MQRVGRVRKSRSGEAEETCREQKQLRGGVRGSPRRSPKGKWEAGDGNQPGEQEGEALGQALDGRARPCVREAAGKSSPQTSCHSGHPASDTSRWTIMS